VFSNVPDFIEAVRLVRQNVQYFIMSTTGVLSFTAIKYSLQQGSEIMRRQKYSLSTCTHTRARTPGFIEAQSCPPCSWDLCPVDFSLWKALQQEVYRQNIRDVDHLKRVL